MKEAEEWASFRLGWVRRSKLVLMNWTIKEKKRVLLGLDLRDGSVYWDSSFDIFHSFDSSYDKILAELEREDEETQLQMCQCNSVFQSRTIKIMKFKCQNHFAFPFELFPAIMRKNADTKTHFAFEIELCLE